MRATLLFLSVAGFSHLPALAIAQPEVLLATPQSAIGSVRDQPLGGMPEEVLTTPFISTQPSREWRAFVEFSLAELSTRSLSRARIAGDIAVNNALDTGTRTIELSVYDADGTVTLADFGRMTMVLGMVSYAPPLENRVSFSFDILTQVQAFQAAGATHLGLRARSTVTDAPNVLSMVTLEVATQCGTGTVEPPEECDDGMANSDTTTDACRTDCTMAGCGDLVVDTGEMCDDGDENSDTEVDACRTNCMPAGCNDGVVDTGEMCDDGAANSDTIADACRTDCQPAECGDGVVDTGEECDEGPANGMGACSLDCEASISAEPMPEAGVDASVDASANGSVDASGPDASIIPGPSSDDGCSCRVPGDPRGHLSSLVWLGVGLAWLYRRRQSGS
ncbi:MAG: MYXO-CTERM sorting domain-containing protein [Myxococcota bacterium]